jgi:ABC-2 type transport system ATP-binding protein
MISFEQKCLQVKQHILDGDFSIAFRKLIDCVLDTKKLDLYKKVIQHMENKPAQSAEAHNEAWMLSLLEDLATIQILPAFDLSTPLLEANMISKRYGRGNFALQEISMKINAGDVWGLVGENGNGKTTFLRILAGDLSYDSGICTYFGKQTSTSYDLRTHLAYIPQRTPTWYGPLKTNLKFAATHYGIKGEENELLVLMYIIRFGLWDYRNHMWSELSSGYKMRFELARTFLRRPKILLLDEPLANLDVLAQQLILEDLKHMSQSLSNPIGIVLSSQQLYEVEKISDKVLFLKQGKPTHLQDANESQVIKTTVLEIDTPSSREQLESALAGLNIVDIQFNGGVYVLEIQEENEMNQVLQAFIQANITLRYVRDISHSTRRLFIA